MSQETVAETLFLISDLCFIFAVFFAILAVVIFVKFKIPTVIGDLSGKNARRSIEQMRSFNESRRKESYHPAKASKKLGNALPSNEITKPESVNEEENSDTGVLEENRIYLAEKKAPTLLRQEEETGVLFDQFETGLLMETGVLDEEQDKLSLTMIEEVMLIHTDEYVA